MFLRTKKLVTTGVAALMLGTSVWAPTVVYAASVDITVGECLQGDLEFGTFIQTIINQHGFLETFVEYWKDILARNYCHSNDIFNLQQQKDKIKARIQHEFLTCNRDKIPNLKKAYYKIDAEIFYSRRLVKVSSDITSQMNPFGSGIDQEGMKLLFGNEGDIYNEMLPIYSGLFGRNEFDVFFSQLKEKYTERKEQYINCPNNAWEMVNDKVHEFIDDWGGVKSGGETLVNNVVKEAQRIKRTATTRPPSSFSDFLGNTFQMEINDVDPVRGLDEIFDRAGEFALSDPNPDLGSVFQASSSQFDIHNKKIDIAKVRATYESLYRNNSDASVREFLTTVDSFVEAVEESHTYLNGIKSCSAKVLNKQCP